MGIRLWANYMLHFDSVILHWITLVNKDVVINKRYIKIDSFWSAHFKSVLNHPQYKSYSGIKYFLKTIICFLLIFQHKLSIEVTQNLWAIENFWKHIQNQLKKVNQVQLVPSLQSFYLSFKVHIFCKMVQIVTVALILAQLGIFSSKRKDLLVALQSTYLFSLNNKNIPSGGRFHLIQVCKSLFNFNMIFWTIYTNEMREALIYVGNFSWKIKAHDFSAIFVFIQRPMNC